MDLGSSHSPSFQDPQGLVLITLSEGAQVFFSFLSLLLSLTLPKLQLPACPMPKGLYLHQLYEQCTGKPPATNANKLAPCYMIQFVSWGRKIISPRAPLPSSIFSREARLHMHCPLLFSAIFTHCYPESKVSFSPNTSPSILS